MMITLSDSDILKLVGSILKYADAMYWEGRYGERKDKKGDKKATKKRKEAGRDICIILGID